MSHANQGPPMDATEPDRAEELEDVLEINSILGRLDRIERELKGLRSFLMLVVLTAAVIMLLFCMVALALNNSRHIVGGTVIDDFPSGSMPATDPLAGPPRADLPGLVAPAAGPPPGASVTDGDALEEGAAVLVESGGQWWRATVLDALADGRVLVRYDGWDVEHDEDVPRDRLRLPPD